MASIGTAAQGRMDIVKHLLELGEEDSEVRVFHVLLQALIAEVGLPRAGGKNPLTPHMQAAQNPAELQFRLQKVCVSVVPKPDPEN